VHRNSHGKVTLGKIEKGEFALDQMAKFTPNRREKKAKCSFYAGLRNAFFLQTEIVLFRDID